MNPKSIITILSVVAMATSAMAGEPDLGDRWQSFRGYLPEDVKENLDLAWGNIDFEKLAKVVSIEERTWCDGIATGKEATEESLKKKCLAVATRHPEAAWIVLRR